MYKQVYKQVYKQKLLNKCFSSGLNSGKIFIRNRELPICSNCLHFIEHTNNYPYDSIPSDEKYGKCKKFGEVNLVTGVIEYDFARTCRLDMNKCGNSGVEYTHKDK